jgi:hypothetical protein
MADPKRREWTMDSIRRAVQAVKGKEMGFLKAAKTVNVSRSTLLDYVKSADFEERLSSSIERKCFLGNELETELLKHYQIMDETFFGLRRRDILVLAYQLAVKKNICYCKSPKIGKS